MPNRDIILFEVDVVPTNLHQDEDTYDDNEDDLFDQAVEAWIDIKLFIENHHLPWLDKKEASVNFIRLCSKS